MFLEKKMIEGGGNIFFGMEGLHNQVLECGFMFYFWLIWNSALSPMWILHKMYVFQIDL